MTRALMLIDVQRSMLEPPAPVPSAASIREALQDLKQGLRAILASGAHATYDENEPAAAISARIERELAAEGVTVIPFGEVSFGDPHS